MDRAEAPTNPQQEIETSHVGKRGGGEIQISFSFLSFFPFSVFKQIPPERQCKKRSEARRGKGEALSGMEIGLGLWLTSHRHRNRH